MSDREIKIRAWDKIEKKMVPVEGVRWRDGKLVGIIINGTSYTDFKIESVDDRFELMQSTSMKDKNGAEIFDRDILKTKWGIEEVQWGWDDFEGV